MSRKSKNRTKLEIIQVATKLFLENGYSQTSPRMISDDLDISTGNLTYYFPTKEHLLAIIRKNDAQRAKKVFGEYRKDWTDGQFLEAELLVSGMEYATLMTTGEPISLETRIWGALHNILTIYGVPEERRNRKLQKVLAMDYRAIGLRVLQEFKEYVAQTNQHALEGLKNKAE